MREKTITTQTIKKIIGAIIMSQTLFSNSACIAAEDTNSSHWDPKVYKNNSVKLQQTTSIQLIDKMGLEGKTKSEVLDLGCGDGKLTRYIAEKTPTSHVIGTDISPGMIELAQKEFSGIRNLTFQVGDAANFFFDRHFNIVTSFFCLQWVPNKQETFRLIAKHLKVGGKFYGIMTDRNPFLLKVRQQMMQNPEWAFHLKSYVDPTNVIDDDRYDEYAVRAGLKVIHFEQYPKDVFFDSYDELRTFIKMVTPAVNVLPEKLVDPFVDELVAGYLHYLPEKNSTKYYITYNIKTLIAAKPGSKL